MSSKFSRTLQNFWDEIARKTKQARGTSTLLGNEEIFSMVERGKDLEKLQRLVTRLREARTKNLPTKTIEGAIFEFSKSLDKK